MLNATASYSGDRFLTGEMLPGQGRKLTRVRGWGYLANGWSLSGFDRIRALVRLGVEDGRV